MPRGSACCGLAIRFGQVPIFVSRIIWGIGGVSSPGQNAGLEGHAAGVADTLGGDAPVGAKNGTHILDVPTLAPATVIVHVPAPEVLLDLDQPLDVRDGLEERRPDGLVCLSVGLCVCLSYIFRQRPIGRNISKIVVNTLVFRANGKAESASESAPPTEFLDVHASRVRAASASFCFRGRR